MIRVRRGCQIAAVVAVLGAFVALYRWMITMGDPTDRAAFYRETALLVAIPTLLWLTASWLLVRHLWPTSGIRWSMLDPPGRVLVTAVAALPERRREWGAAMLAELAEVRGRRDRWRFALSSARAALWLPRAGRWPVLVLLTGAVAAATVAARPVVGAAVPGLGVFAASFVGLAGAVVILAVVGVRRIRLPLLAPTVVVTGSVAAAVAATVTFLLRQPTAADFLPPAQAVFLAAVLACCLWGAIALSRSLAADRRGPHLGVVAAVLFVIGLLLLTRTDPAVQDFLVLWLLFLPPVVFGLPSCLAGALHRSFHSGLRAGVWTAITLAPLTFALTLAEALRRLGLDGELLFDGDGGPVGINLSDALHFLWIVPMIGFPFAVIGAAAGAGLTGTAAAKGSGGT